MNWEITIRYQHAHVKGANVTSKAKLEKQREEEKVHQFLMGLDDVVYGTTRSSLLVTDPLPLLNRVYANLIQEERVKAISRTKEERTEIVSLAVQTGGRARGRGDTKDKGIVCSNWNRTGHDTMGCFQIVGYPDWWGDRPRHETKAVARMKGQQQGRCANSGRGRGMGVQANVAQATFGRTVEAAAEVDNGGLAALSTEQWQILVNMLDSHKGNPSERMTGKEAWIIDTGASNHMTGNLRLLQELKEVQGCPVDFPDGQKLVATKEGTTTLDGGLKLSNVLYVPKLSCSLISVTQLIDETNCVVQFSNSLCDTGPHFEDADWIG